MQQGLQRLLAFGVDQRALETRATRQRALGRLGLRMHGLEQRRGVGQFRLHGVEPDRGLRRAVARRQARVHRRLVSSATRHK
jgi:hypothetical protein